MTRAGLPLVLACALACAPAPPPSPAAPSPIAVRQSLPNGWLEIVVPARNPRGEAIVFRATVSATARAVRGPLAVRVTASGLGPEVTLRVLEAPSDGLDARASETRSLALRWDGRDSAGIVPPADEYVLVVELASQTGGTETPVSLGVVFSLTEP